MTALDLALTACELRQKADRYRALAAYLGDARQAAVVEDLAACCDARADELTRDIKRLRKAA